MFWKKIIEEESSRSKTISNYISKTTKARYIRVLNECIRTIFTQVEFVTSDFFSQTDSNELQMRLEKLKRAWLKAEDYFYKVIAEGVKPPAIDELRRDQVHADKHFYSVNSAIMKRLVELQPDSIAKQPNTANKLCPHCSEPHTITKCTAFIAMPIPERVAAVKNANICLNCFRFGHNANGCFRPPCSTCHRKHNGILCEKRQNNKWTMKSNIFDTQYVR